jgi:sulfite exporter TauE/SafE
MVFNLYAGNYKWLFVILIILMFVFVYVVFFVFGFMLGEFGSILNIGGNFQAILQLFAGIYMIAVALNLLEIHPIFRFVIIQPPKALTRLIKLIKNQSKSRDLFAPAILGAMTVFLPCGTTLAMETLAISSASGWQGASIMGAFILGTIPVFMGIGLLTSVLGNTYKQKFLKLAAVLVIYIGLTSMNGALIAMGFPVNSETISQKFNELVAGDNDNNSDVQASQEITITVNSNGYYPNYVKVKKGLPVKLTLVGKGVYSCASAFRIPSMGISANLLPEETQVFTFTPTRVGKIPFSCSMGMYRGVIEVI